MNDKPVILLVEDDADAAGDYKEDIEAIIDVTVIPISPPPRDLLDLLALVEDYHADAVILDQVLPQCSDATYLGIDALQYLRETFPGLPTVILTAFPDNPALKGRGLPWDDFVKKREFDDNQEIRESYLRELYRRMRLYRQTQDDLRAPLESSTTITEQLVRRLASLHFKTEDTIEQIVWFTRGDDTVIRLIEINRTALPTGKVEVFSFAPSADIPFPTLIADVTPNEWQEIRSGHIPLPESWDLASAQVFSRAATLLGAEEQHDVG